MFVLEHGLHGLVGLAIVFLLCSHDSKRLSSTIVDADGNKVQNEPFTDEQIAKVVDFSLTNMDKNKDGLITYSEFRLA